jgi:hypothetical protein
VRDGKGTGVMEGQGTMGGKDKEQWEGSIRNSEEGTRNCGEINRKKQKTCRKKH